MLVVEVDGGYHDAIPDEDIARQEHLQQLGWTVVRFTDREVEEDAEAVARAIANELQLAYDFQKRRATGSGMMGVDSAKQNKPK